MKNLRLIILLTTTLLLTTCYTIVFAPRTEIQQQQQTQSDYQINPYSQHSFDPVNINMGYGYTFGHHYQRWNDCHPYYYAHYNYNNCYCYNFNDYYLYNRKFHFGGYYPNHYPFYGSGNYTGTRTNYTQRSRRTPKIKKENKEKKQEFTESKYIRKNTDYIPMSSGSTSINTGDGIPLGVYIPTKKVNDTNTNNEKIIKPANKRKNKSGVGMSNSKDFSTSIKNEIKDNLKKSDRIIPKQKYNYQLFNQSNQKEKLSNKNQTEEINKSAKPKAREKIKNKISSQRNNTNYQSVKPSKPKHRSNNALPQNTNNRPSNNKNSSSVSRNRSNSSNNTKSNNQSSRSSSKSNNSKKK